MNKREIGLYAGKVWRLLVDNTRWSYTELKKISGLQDTELSLALGWLARENKIELDESEEGLYVYQCVNVYIG